MSHNLFLKKVKLNAASHSYSQLVTVLIQFVLVPIFIGFWGVDRYADWVVLSSIPMILTVLDFGVGQASANKATMCAASCDHIGVERSLQTAIVFTLLLGFGLLIIAFLINREINWPALLNLKTISVAEAKVVGFCLVAHLSFYLMGGPFDGLFRAIDKTPLGIFLLANRRMADFFITLLVLYLGGGVVELSLAILLTQAVFCLFMVFLINNISIYNIFSLKYSSVCELKSILKPSLTYCFFPISQAVTIQGGVFILNQLSDSKTLVGFTMARTLTRLIIQIGVIANNSLKPELSRLIGLGETESAKIKTRSISRKVLLICCFLYLVISIFGVLIIDLWSGGRVVVDYFVIPLIGIHVILNVAWFVPNSLSIAANKHGAVASVYFLASILTMFFLIIYSGFLLPLVSASALLIIPELAVVIFYFYPYKKRVRNFI